ncbi:MAG TPA: hypothetical protein VJ343_00970 [archaeon]|nr:hypothetical protein [archaeon]
MSDRENFIKLFFDIADSLLSRAKVTRPKIISLGEYMSYRQLPFWREDDLRISGFAYDGSSASVIVKNYKIAPEKRSAVHETAHHLLRQKNPFIKKYIEASTELRRKLDDLNGYLQYWKKLFEEGFAIWFTSMNDDKTKREMDSYQLILDKLRRDEEPSKDEYWSIGGENRPYIYGYDFFDKIAKAFGEDITFDFAMSICPTQEAMEFAYGKACKSLGTKDIISFKNYLS